MNSADPRGGGADRMTEITAGSDHVAGRAAWFVGRVGALAAALGIGAVLGPLSIASANPDSSASEESSAPAATNRSSAPADRGRSRAPRTGTPSNSPTAQAPQPGGAGSQRGAGQLRSVPPAAATGPRRNEFRPAGLDSAAPQPSASTADRDLPGQALPQQARTAQTPPVPTPDTSPVTVDIAASPLSNPIPGSAVQAAAVSAPEFTPVAPPQAFAAPAPASSLNGLVEAVLTPLLGIGSALPMESPLGWAALAVSRRLGRTELSSVPAPAAATTTSLTVPGAATSTSASTTTRITWAWGTDAVLAFDPVADKLDFGWMQPANFDIAETDGSTQIAIVGNEQTYTLDGVALGQMSTANIIALDQNTLTKWQSAIDAAEPVTTPPVTTPPVTNPPVTNPPVTNPPVTNPPVTTPPVTTPPITDPPVTTPPVSIPGDATTAQWGETFFAPYVDMAGWPVPDLLTISEATGASLMTVAFLQSTPDATLAWAGLPALEPGADTEQAQAINRSIKALQDAGGDVMISLGGAAGTSLAQAYVARSLDAATLADAYGEVVDTYQISHLDFDIEGSAVADIPAIDLHSQALAILGQSRPDLEVWYTLPVLPSGLTADGLNVVESALQAGVNLAGVNVMAMDYGESAAPTSGPNAQTMGTYAIQSAESTHTQLSQLYSDYGRSYDWSQLGVTPMIGVNDVLTEVFTPADAQALEDFARVNGLGMLSMWSVSRDTPGSLGQATPIASGLSEAAGSFSRIFNDYGTVNVVDYTAPTPAPGGGTPDGGTLTPGGTTTTISWKWATDTVLDFDPAADQLDFGWFQPTNFDIAETDGSTQIAIVGNNQTYTLDGVGLNQISTANIIALDQNTLTKWQNAIGATGPVTTPPVTTPPVTTPPVTPPPVTTPPVTDPPVTTPPVTDPPVTNPPVTTPPVTNPGGGTPDGGTLTPGGTTTTISWKWATDTVLDFDPAADQLDFGWFQPTNFDIAETDGSTQIAIVGNNQTYTLDGVGLNQISTANIIALDQNTLTKWQNAIGATGPVTTPPVTTPVTPPPVTTPPVTTPPVTNPPVTTPPVTTPPVTTPPVTTPPVTTPPVTTPGAGDLAIAQHDGVLAAYFPEWGIYDRDFQVADIPADQLTHVIYSFLNVKSNGEVALYDSYAAVDKRFGAADSVSGEADLWYYPPGDPRAEQTVWGNFNQIAQLKEQYPHLRTTIAIGGWTLSGNFSTVASTAAGRETMTDSIVSFLDTYQMFDGVDFDWEYPGGGGLASNSVSPDDGENYAALLAELRQKLDVLGEQNGRTYEISVAAPGGYDKIANFNAAGLAPSVDHFNLMSYDFHGTWEDTTGHQSAVTGDPNGYDMATAVSLYLAAGVDPGKLVLGAPLYTRGWSGVADGGDGGYSESAGGAAPGTFEAGVYDYKDLLAQVQDPNSGWQLYWDDTAQAAYVYNPVEKLFSSIETPTSIAQKAQWAEDLGLGGMMFWDISNDATGSAESLITAAYRSSVLDQDMASIRADSSLTGERIIGGDGAITALPVNTGGSVTIQL